MTKALDQPYGVYKAKSDEKIGEELQIVGTGFDRVVKYPKM